MFFLLSKKIVFKKIPSSMQGFIMSKFLPLVYSTYNRFIEWAFK